MDSCHLSPVSGTISIYTDCAIAIQNSKKLLKSDLLQIAKCMLTNTKRAGDALLKGRLTSLDPIVGEDGCQVRAIVALNAYLNPELREEIKSLLDPVDDLLKRLNHLINIQGKSKDVSKYNPQDTLPDQLASLGLSLFVSKRVDYLCRSHLLTIGKFFHMTSDGRETCGIDCQNIKDRLKTKLSKGLLEMVVHVARERMSVETIGCIQSEAALIPQAKHLQAQLEDRCIRVIHSGNYTFNSSCAFYNLKVVMLRAFEMQLPILIKEHGSKTPMGIYFRSETVSEEALKLNQAILVIEGFFPEKMSKLEVAEAIQSHGLMNVVLANVALTNQYSSDDDISLLDLDAKDEIAKYRSLGKELGCQTSFPKIFSIAHIHAATVKEEKVR